MPEKKMLVLDSAARETEFIVDGETYRLRFNFEAIAGFEEGTGINPISEPIPPTTFNIMCLLYAGLQAHHSEITMETVESWFNDQNGVQLGKVAFEAFYGSLPEPKAKDEDGTPDPLKA
jgi:hypothetical protein